MHLTYNLPPAIQPMQTLQKENFGAVYLFDDPTIAEQFATYAGRILDIPLLDYDILQGGENPSYKVRIPDNELRENTKRDKMPELEEKLQNIRAHNRFLNRFLKRTQQSNS